MSIALCMFHIAGTNYRMPSERAVAGALKRGDLLAFEPEPEPSNQHDRFAVKIVVPDSDDRNGGTQAHVGYIPRGVNEPIANLLQAGKKMSGVVASVAGAIVVVAMLED